jgi:hypothetical protein
MAFKQGAFKNGLEVVCVKSAIVFFTNALASSSIDEKCASVMVECVI